jgi:MFS family permease
MDEECIISCPRAKRGCNLVKKWRSDTSGAGAIVLGLAALDAAGYSVIAPTLPSIADATGAGPALIGVLVATFPAGMLVGFALAGPGVTRGRTQLVLACSLVAVALGCAGFVLGDDLAAYLPARTLMGLGSGGLWLGLTFETLERSPGREYVAMARLLAAYSAGSLVGPAVGALGGVRAPFAAYLALVLLGLAAALALRPAPNRRRFSSDRSALRLPGFWLAAGIELVAVIGLGLIEGVLPLHLATELGQAAIAALYAGLALLVAVAAAAAGHIKPQRVVAVGVALMVVGIAATGMAGAVGVWIVGLGAAGVGFGLADTGSVGILLGSVGTERIVTAMIVWSQIGIAGYLIGPLAGGAVAEGLSFAWIGLVPLVAAAGLAVLALALRGSYAAAADATAGSARKGTRYAGSREQR